MSGKTFARDRELASNAGKISKRGKDKLTILKEKIGISDVRRTSEMIKRNMDYFANHKDEKLRFEATRAFAEYYLPKKRSVEEKITDARGTIKIKFE